MDIQSNHSGPERSRQDYVQQQRALIDACRAFVRAAGEDMAAVAREQQARLREVRDQAVRDRAVTEPPARQRDELQLSDAARKAASEPSSGDREARIRDLAEAHRMNRLHTPERIERAAQRLLEG